MKRNKNLFKLADYKAVIFDLDGVISKTAKVHARAWEKMFDEYLQFRKDNGKSEFRQMKIDEDYPLYIDGIPRYEGVKSFLKSRNIGLDYGDPGDDPGKETVCGLGNRKNEIFRELIQKEGVDLYQDTVEKIRIWRKKGLKTGVVSSSKNCEMILNKGGISNLFDTRVDGIVSSKLNLKGKPDPDIFLKAADYLNLNSSDCAVVEDALSGVEAGHAGKFKLVIGIDRHNQKKELLEHGADIVVKSLKEIEFDGQKLKYFKDIPSAIKQQNKIIEKLKGKKPVFFLDYDGTLTPIVKHPEDAILSSEMRDELRNLASNFNVAIISGRDLDDVKKLVNLEQLIYAGSHGFDISGPDNLRMQNPSGLKCLPELDDAEKILKKNLSSIKNAEVERKKFAIAIHFRNVDEKLIHKIQDIVDEVDGNYPQLKKDTGKKIFELKPNIDWDKGHAVLWLLDKLNLNSEKFTPIYIGDDLTDEDAFKSLPDRGISILVGDHGKETSANYKLKSVQEAKRFLQWIKEREMNDWKIIYDKYIAEHEPLKEALCTLGNGYFATRGAVEECKAGGKHYPGIYLACGYDRLPSKISGEEIENEDLVNWPNWLFLTFRHKGEEFFNIDKVEILDYTQELDLKEGILNRKIRFRDDAKRETTLVCRRVVHMANCHLAAIQWVIKPENWSGEIEIHSALDGTVTNSGVERYKELRGDHLDPLETRVWADDSIFLKVQTKQSRLRMAQSARTEIFSDGKKISTHRKNIEKKGYVAQEISVECKEKKSIRVEKIVSIFTSRDHAISEEGLESRSLLKYTGDFEELLKSHKRVWNKLWHACDIQIDADEKAQEIMRLHIFHLIQTASFNTIDLDVGIPSRGWHGEAYRGHIFWDELFIFPFLNLGIPELTRALLMYRYRRLNHARKAAREAGYRGAMFPWQSGSNGREESQQIHLNPKTGKWGTDNTYLQRHVNTTIAYNVWQYCQITNDMEFLTFYGAELILDIAKFLSSLTIYNDERKRYEIHHVVGPDEYHTAYPGSGEPGLNNNAYTNIMTVWVFKCAGNVLKVLPENRLNEIFDQLQITTDELERWRDIQHRMYIPFHNGDIISQFEGYEKLEEFDWERYRKKYDNIQRLDRILGAEGDTPNKYKASKQADVLMLFYLFSADELLKLIHQLGYSFEPESILKNINYYQERTSHGSTLSRLVFSWVLARSNREESWHLFRQALNSDFKDIQGGTTPEGIHLGAMAGTIDMVQRCYSGLEIHDDVLWIDPALPDELRCVKFRIRYRGHWVLMQFYKDKLSVSFEEGYSREVKIGVQGKVYTFEQGDSREFIIN